MTPSVTKREVPHTERGLLRRAVAVLDALAVHQAPPSVRVIAEQSELSKSAVQRILVELESVDLAAKDATTRRYRLGPRTLALGMAYQRGVSVRQAALAHMTALREDCKETVGLSVGYADRLLHIDQVEAHRNLQARFDIGRPLPLWSGAPARVLLAARPDEEVRRILDLWAHTDFEPINPPSPQTLLLEVASVRTEGHARAFEETLVGVNTISVPVTGGRGELAAVLSVTAPSSRLSSHGMDQLLPRLRSAAAAISADVGWSDTRTAFRPGVVSLGVGAGD